MNDQSGLIYEILFETVTEALIVANKEGKIELANTKACEMFGYTKEEFYALKVDDLLPHHLVEKHVQHRTKYAENPHSRPMGQGYDLIGVRKDGSALPIEISLNHFVDQGNFKAMALIMDVTKRKEQEAQIKILNKNLEKRVAQRTRELKESQNLYSLIARNFPNGTINVFDKNFKYIFVEGEDLYRHGITSERLMGKSYLDQLPAEVKTMMEKRLNAVMAGETQTFEVQLLQHHYLINAVGLIDHSGKTDKILLVEQNITDRKKAEERVKEALEKEKLLNELKSRFVSMASHEFRTPLSTILSSLSLIEKYDQLGEADKKDKHYRRIRNEVRHLTGILNDFLSLEKVETGKVVVNLSKVNLRELLHELIEQQREVSKPAQQIQLSYKGNDVMVTDQNMMRIIASNLLSNAVKYSGEGKSIWINVSVENNQTKLSVRDEGIGIPYEDQANMFERFFRAKNTVNLEGTGLGLNIVRRYLQLLDGEISFESVPDEGTTFTVHLPNKPL